MNPQEIKTRLERALHTTITPAEWIHLWIHFEELELVHDYSRGSLSWQDFRDLADRELSRIRTFFENKRREEAGELEETPRDNGADRQPEPAPVVLDEPTSARSLALGALNRLRSGGSAPPRATIASTVLPCGGVDGTVPQWVWVMAAELWVPAEEIAKAFRAAQRTRMVEIDKRRTHQPRTQARAFHVARFVWEMEAAFGERPSWPELCKSWNDRRKSWEDDRRNDDPMARRFENWRDFRTYFLRGEKATRPRYKATDEEITEQVREASKRSGPVAFDSWIRDVLAATVQPDAR